MSPPKKRLRKPSNVSTTDKESVQTKKVKETVPRVITRSTKAYDNAEDWRTVNWASRIYHAATNDLFCDVSFIVGPEKKTFRAHRLILTLSSPVFEAMFHGHLAEKGPSVTITDITPEGFEALLKYIYTGESISNYNVDTLLQLWVAADKYCVPQVKEECTNFFTSVELSPQNAWSTLQAALFLGIDKLMARAKYYLSTETDQAILSEGFLSVNVETMASFLSMTHIHCKESELLKMLVKWGKAQKGESLKKAIEPCIKLIRFRRLSNLEFCDFLDTAKGVVSESDAMDIFKHIARPYRHPLPEWCCTEDRKWRHQDGRLAVVSCSSDYTSDDSLTYRAPIRARSPVRVAVNYESSSDSSSLSDS